jgi:hypothetical protein
MIRRKASDPMRSVVAVSNLREHGWKRLRADRRHYAEKQSKLHRSTTTPTPPLVEDTAPVAPRRVSRLPKDPYAEAVIQSTLQPVIRELLPDLESTDPARKASAIQRLQDGLMQAKGYVHLPWGRSVFREWQRVLKQYRGD